MRPEDINSLDSESGVIATLIHHPDWCFHSEQLLPNHFSNYTNQCIYTAICELAKRGISTIDPYNIIEVLNSNDATKKFAEELDISRLWELVDMSDSLNRVSIEEYKMLVQNIINAAFRRDAYRALKECEGIVCKDNQEDIGKQIYGLIDDVVMSYSQGEEVTEFKDIVDELWAEVEDHQDGRNGGIPFKFPTLNEYVRIEQGELVVVGAPAKGAKSMFMLNEAVDILKQGKSVMYLDSELSSRLFLCRLVSHLTGIEFARVRSGRYTEEENELIKEQLEWIKKQKFVHIYMPIFQPDSIYTAVKKVFHRFNPLDVLIVDYLKPSGKSTEAFQTYAELGNLCDLVKNSLCGDLGIAGLAAAQLTSSGRLADSAKIARNASTILLLTDKTLDEFEADGGEVAGRKKLFVAQNRNGMQHVEGEWINICFDGNRCLLTESSKRHILEDPF